MATAEHAGPARNGRGGPERLATFRGVVTCHSSPDILGLMLCGQTTEAPGEATALAFSAVSSTSVPETLLDPAVERIGAAEYRIASAGREWLVHARAVHLHRDISAQFYRALPPRPAPWAKRLLWRVVLALAGSRAGLIALRAVRR